MNDIPEPARLRAAPFVTAISAVRYPAYPDPSTASGWAELPAVMLLVDFTGREDVVYAAMIGAQALWANDISLQTTRPNPDGTCLYLITMTFDGLDPLDLAGVATPDALAVFVLAELLLLTSSSQVTDDAAPILAFAPNDPTSWFLDVPN